MSFTGIYYGLPVKVSLATRTPTVTSAFRIVNHWWVYLHNLIYGECNWIGFCTNFFFRIPGVIIPVFFFSLSVSVLFMHRLCLFDPRHIYTTYIRVFWLNFFKKTDLFSVFNFFSLHCLQSPSQKNPWEPYVN